jgi:hypothetical protein
MQDRALRESVMMKANILLVRAMQKQHESASVDVSKRHMCISRSFRVRFAGD